MGAEICSSMANLAKNSLSDVVTIKPCSGTSISLMDRISELPDDILVNILSLLLTMQEAVSTSVLSKRWSYVWATIPVLNFDASKVLDMLLLGDKELEVERPRYVRWVNQVVRSYNGDVIDEFKVGFDIDASSSCDIDNWVKFAMDKRVKKFKLDLSEYWGGPHEKCYNFPELYSLGATSSLLTSLELHSLDVTGDVLHSFLNNCPNLQLLSVRSSKTLVELRVPHTSIKLSYLDIYCCWEVKNIEIYAPNLVSFKYHGPIISFPFISTSTTLVELSIGGRSCDHIANRILELKSSLSQLESLELSLTTKILECMRSSEFPLCKRLKKLYLKVEMRIGEGLFVLWPLIKACPFLHKFVLELDWWTMPDSEIVLKEEEEVCCPHYNLKIVEILGFIGNATDLKFVTYVMNNIVSPEKLIIDPRDPGNIGSPWEFTVDQRQITARHQAELLRHKLKPGTELIIL